MTTPPDPTVCPHCGQPGDHRVIPSEPWTFFSCPLPKPAASSPAAIICPNCLKPGNHWQRPTAVGQPGKYSCAAETPTPETPFPCTHLSVTRVENGGFCSHCHKELVYDTDSRNWRLPRDGEAICEFCEIDGMGNHAPRCPVELERQLERVKTELRSYKERFFSHPAVVEVHREREQLRTELTATTAEVARLRSEHKLAFDVTTAAFDQITQNLTGKLDLMRDEFKRIKACPMVTHEIKGICDRAVSDIEQHVSVIAQRDRAESDLATANATIAELREWRNEAEGELLKAGKNLGEIVDECERLRETVARLERERDNAVKARNELLEYRHDEAEGFTGKIRPIDKLADFADSEYVRDNKALRTQLAEANKKASELQDEVCAAFRKHGLAAGPTAIDRLVEERDAARAECEQAKKERDDETGTVRAITAKLQTERGYSDRLRAALLEVRQHLDSWKISAIPDSIATIDSALAGQPAVSPQLLAAFNLLVNSGHIKNPKMASVYLQNNGIPVALDGSRFVAGGQAE